MDLNFFILGNAFNKKIEAIAKEIYGAGKIIVDAKIKKINLIKLKKMVLENFLFV